MCLLNTVVSTYCTMYMPFTISNNVYTFTFQSFFRLGSVLIELEHYDEALNVLKNGLNMKTTDENKYEIFKKIMLLAYKWEGIFLLILYYVYFRCI